MCGTCESIYTLIPHVASSNDPETIVSKVRNYVNCLKKPIWEIGILANVGHDIKIENDIEVGPLSAIIVAALCKARLFLDECLFDFRV